MAEAVKEFVVNQHDPLVLKKNAAVTGGLIDGTSNLEPNYKKTAISKRLYWKASEKIVSHGSIHYCRAYMIDNEFLKKKKYIKNVETFAE